MCSAGSSHPSCSPSGTRYCISCIEVEEVLARHPAIAEVSVVGVPDDVKGEEVCAAVVPRTDLRVPSAEEVIAWSRERLGGHKYPRKVVFMTALPLGPTGKVLKRELRKTCS
ncbi:AMP-binding enzyme [Stenotrophomonas sp. NPDC087984]